MHHFETHYIWLMRCSAQNATAILPLVWFPYNSVLRRHFPHKLWNNSSFIDQSSEFNFAPEPELFILPVSQKSPDQPIFSIYYPCTYARVILSLQEKWKCTFSIIELFILMYLMHSFNILVRRKSIKILWVSSLNRCVFWCTCSNFFSRTIANIVIVARLSDTAFQ